MKRLLFAVLVVPPIAAAMELPQLPVRAAYSGRGAICGSSEMLQNLNARFWRVVGHGDASDLQIECEEDSDGLSLKVHAPGKGAEFTVERTPNNGFRPGLCLAAAGA